MVNRREEDMAVTSVYSTGMNLEQPNVNDSNNPMSTVERLLSNHERSKANKAALDEQ